LHVEIPLENICSSISVIAKLRVLIWRKVNTVIAGVCLTMCLRVRERGDTFSRTFSRTVEYRPA